MRTGAEHHIMPRRKRQRMGVVHAECYPHCNHLLTDAGYKLPTAVLPAGQEASRLFARAALVVNS